MFDHMQYSRILSAVCSAPWAMRRETMDVMMSVLLMRAQGIRFTEEEKTARIATARADAPGGARGESRGVVAVIPLVGMIIHRPDLIQEVSSGATPIQRFVQKLDTALADDNVRSIVLDIESPGGIVSGIPEAAERVFAARSGAKRVVAVANVEAGSAAYWIASAADELIVSPSGEVGSVGVWTAHIDASKYFEKEGLTHTLISAGKYKVEGHPFGPLDEEAKAYRQSQVDATYSQFISAIAKHRNRSNSDVKDQFGQGRMVDAKEAVRLGMADRVGTLEETITRMAGPRGAPRKAKASTNFLFSDFG